MRAFLRTFNVQRLLAQMLLYTFLFFVRFFQQIRIFYFRGSSVSNELNSNIVNFVAVGYTSVLTQKKVFHLFFSGDYNSRRLFSESVTGDI